MCHSVGEKVKQSFDTIFFLNIILFFIDFKETFGIWQQIDLCIISETITRHGVGNKSKLNK